MEDAGALLKEARERKGFSQGQLANAMNCERSKISKIEIGEEVPQVYFLSRCAGVMNDVLLAWQTCGLCRSLLSFPVLDKEVIDRHPIAALFFLLEDLNDAESCIKKAPQYLREKRELSKQDLSFLDELLFKIGKLIPDIILFLFALEERYSHDPRKMKELLLENFSEKAVLEERVHISGEKEKCEL